MLLRFRGAVEKGDLEEAMWNKKVEALSIEGKNLLNSLLNPDFSKIEFPDFSDKKLATRDTNHVILNEIAKNSLALSVVVQILLLQTRLS